MSELPALSALAAFVGVESQYIGFDGGPREVPFDTQRALLAAMGYDARDETRAAQTLAALQAHDSAPGLANVSVLRGGAAGRPHVELRLGPYQHGELSYVLELELEDGRLHRGHGRAHIHPHLTLPLPDESELPFGYHRLRCVIELDGRSFESEQSLIVTPGRCVGASELVGGRRVLGLWTHVYALRSARSWGCGDLRDLRTLLMWASSHGLELVGINPLHATDVRAPEVNPYFPQSRMYRSPIYLDVEAVVAAVGSTEAALLLDDPALLAERSALEARERIDYPAVAALKRRVLELAHAGFARHHRDAESPLGKAYTQFRTREGQALEDFARFCALREHLSAGDAGCADFRAWPADLRERRSAAVEAACASMPEAVDLHAFMQFQLDRQLAECQREGRSTGMAIGLYGDLALGDGPGSADIWAAPERYAQGASVGAPPDAYSDSGQGWGLVPLHPRRMRAEAYSGYIALLRRAFRHAGMLRIDHVMGITRQFWVPDGATAAQGGYVRFPEEDLLGILALESRRAGALVVGEDLGVVPHGLREEMAARQVMRSQVLYFERDADGGFVSPREYARDAFVTVGTHDLPTLSGFIEGRDLRVRRRADNIESDEVLERALADRSHAVAALLRALRAERLLPEIPDRPTIEALTEAVYRFLADGHSRLLGLSLDDLTLERDALNTPATHLADAPNWSRRCHITLESLARDARIAALLRDLRARVWPA